MMTVELCPHRLCLEDAGCWPYYCNWAKDDCGPLVDNADIESDYVEGTSFPVWCPAPWGMRCPRV